MGAALSNDPGVSMTWIDARLQSAGSWPLFIAPPMDPKSSRSKIEATGERRNRIPMLIEMAARRMIVNRELDERASISLQAKFKRFITQRHPPRNKSPELLLDVQCLLLQHTKTLGEYRELVRSGWIEEQAQSDFCHMKLKEFQETGFYWGEKERWIHPINDSLMQAYEQARLDQRARELFFKMFFLNACDSLSVEEKREWIFASRHAPIAPFILFIFKIKRVVQARLTQWITAFSHRMNVPLRNRWQPASFKVWRMSLLPILYTIWRVVLRVQTAIWKAYFASLRKIVFATYIQSGLFNPSLYGVRHVIQIGLFIFNHQLALFLGSSFLLAGFLHLYPQRTRPHQVIAGCLTVPVALALAPNFILLPLILPICLLAKRVFQSSFSHRVYEKTRYWIWPLLETSPALSSAETDYLHQVAGSWGRRFVMLNKGASF